MSGTRHRESSGRWWGVRGYGGGGQGRGARCTHPRHAGDVAVDHHAKKIVNVVVRRSRSKKTLVLDLAALERAAKFGDVSCVGYHHLEEGSLDAVAVAPDRLLVLDGDILDAVPAGFDCGREPGQVCWCEPPGYGDVEVVQEARDRAENRVSLGGDAETSHHSGIAVHSLLGVQLLERDIAMSVVNRELRPGPLLLLFVDFPGLLGHLDQLLLESQRLILGVGAFGAFEEVMRRPLRAGWGIFDVLPRAFTVHELCGARVV